nr:MAG TPA_asm: hypothetical protein [Caudoviricetes sp.]
MSEKENQEALIMKFDPRTIEHLGIKMYSSFHAALAELIANAYDANATNVHIDIVDNGIKKITVRDDGDGMTFDDVNKKFLVIGRNRRVEDKAEGVQNKRKVMGRKGLGKLSLFGLGNTVDIETKVKGSITQTHFTLVWSKIKESFNKEEYKPFFKTETADKDFHGTKIILSDLNRKKKFDVDLLKRKIVQMFHGLDNNFRIFISYNGSDYTELEEKLKYDNINKEFEWKFEDFYPRIKADYKNKTKIKGVIYSSVLPLPGDQRGITIFANKRMANEPSFFGAALESNYFFSYITGWLDIDFIDEGESEIISTSRQNINWESEHIEGLQEYLHRFLKDLETDWRIKRKEIKKKKISQKTGINIKKWTDTMPKYLGDAVLNIVDNIVEDIGTQEDTANSTIRKIKEIIPEYPLYHWRHLHSDIQDAAKGYYQNADYYDSIQEALKRYVSSVRTQAQDNDSAERDLMFKNFGMNKGIIKKLAVLAKYKKPNGLSFHSDTVQNIEDSQAQLSAGMIVGFRHPLAHEEKRDLRDSGALTEKDCLDALSLLSYLFRRLDDAKLKHEQ